MNNFKGIDYIIYRGDMNHYCAYIKVPENNKYYPIVNKKRWFQVLPKSKGGSGRHYSLDYDALSDHIDAHGGFTFAENIRTKDWPQGFTKGVWAGWDYAHLGDGGETEDMIKEDVQSVINQLLKI